MQCCLALVVCRVDLCPGVKKRGDDLSLAGGSGDDQGCPSERVTGLNLRVVREEELNDTEVGRRRCPVQGGSAILRDKKTGMTLIVGDDITGV